MSEQTIKTDVSKMESFDSGAKRENKSGKGRYDLIPGDVMHGIIDAIDSVFAYTPTASGITISADDVIKAAYFTDVYDSYAYCEFIAKVVAYFFTVGVPSGNTTVVPHKYVSRLDVVYAMVHMRNELAIHYERGAEIHGVNNWKKGIPISDSEKGGCFVDSMRRHIDQAISGADDEPHAIAAIWNAIGAVWTIKHTDITSTQQDTLEEMDWS